MTRKLVLALLALGVTLAAGATAALAATTRASDEPGVTASSILLGATAPLTGPAAGFAAIARGAQAYFAHVNARGGVNGRRIDYTVLDDSSDPARAPELTRRLVEDEGVFAVFGAYGAAPSFAVRDYLNRENVPQLFVASGATALGSDPARFAYTFGFQPSYTAEGWVLGQYLARTQSAARVGVLFQDDGYGQELLAGLRKGIQRSKVRVVSAQPYDAGATDVEAQVARLRVSGANVFAVFAAPKLATQAFKYANTLGWKPKLTLDGSAATSREVLLAASEKGPNRVVRNAISIAFLKDPSDTRWLKDPSLRVYRKVMKRYAPGADPGDVLHVYGMAAAWTVVEAIRKAGRDLTRDALMEVVGSLNLLGNPFLVPGIVLRTGSDDHFPIEQMALQRWHKGAWRSFGGIWGYRPG
jgi:ABC-type branched-subunit amino acid transport system substrate-binding protein